MARPKNCGRCNKPKSKCKCGRPLFNGKPEKDVIAKLEQAYAFGASDGEACMYADISPDALYRYEKKNPKFRERKLALKKKPILKARQTIIKDIENVDTAKWYLSRKRKEEFSTKSVLEHEKAIPIKLDKEGEKRIKKYENENQEVEKDSKKK